MRDLHRGRAWATRPGGGSVEEVDVYRGVPRGGADVHRPGERQAAEGRRRRRQRHGRPDGRPAARAPPARPRRDLLDARRQRSPTTSPTRCCRRTAQFIIDKVVDEGADLGIAWDGDADRCFFIDDTGRFVDGDFLTAILAEHLLAKQPERARSSTTCAPRARSPTSCAPPAAAAFPNRVGHAFFKTRMRDEGAIFGGEVSRPLLLPRLLQRRLRHDPGAADPREALGRGQDAERAARALPRQVLHLRRDQLRGRRPGRRRWRELEERYADGAGQPTSTASRSTTTTGTSTCARRTPSRCCACASSRSVSREDMERRRDEVLGLIRS